MRGIPHKITVCGWCKQLWRTKHCDKRLTTIFRLKVASYKRNYRDITSPLMILLKVFIYYIAQKICWTEGKIYITIFFVGLNSWLDNTAYHTTGSELRMCLIKAPYVNGITCLIIKLEYVHRISLLTIVCIF